MCVLWVSNTMWSVYLFKYVLKAEAIGMLITDSGITQALGLENVSANEARVLQGVVLNQPWTVAEAALHLAGIPLVEFTEPVKLVTSQPPNSRQYFVGKYGGGAMLAPVDIYIKRPEELEECTFTRFWTDHVVDTNKRSKGVGALVGEAQVGNRVHYVYQRLPDKPEVVRFSDPHPGHACEAFFYNVLLDEVPFRNEQELISADNKKVSYFEECQMRGLADDEAIERRVQAWSERHLHEEEVTQRALMAIKQNYLADGTEGVGYVEEDIAAAAAAQLINLPPKKPLNARQRAFVDGVLARPYGLHILLGPPGTGKSWTLEALEIELWYAGKVVMKSATTGVAASRMTNASTVHSDYRINPSKSRLFSNSGDPKSNNLRLRLCNAFIIDEAMMMDVFLLESVVGRIQGACNDPSPGGWLKEKLLILIGDECQLAPVCSCLPRRKQGEDDAELVGCDKCHIGNSKHVEGATIHRLEVSERHAQDPELAHFLKVLPDRLPTEAEVAETFGRFLVRPEEQEAFMAQPGARSIHAHRLTAQRTGLAQLRRAFPLPTRTAANYAVIQPKSNLAELRARGLELKQEHVQWLEDPDFHELQEVAVGAPVIITTNINKKAKTLNSCTGVVTALEYKKAKEAPQQEELFTVKVRMDSTGQVQDIRRSFSDKIHAHGAGNLRRWTFPLVLGYSMTAHRAQGGTFTCPTIIDANGVFAPGQLYVMISRNPTRELMRFTALPAPKAFKVNRIFRRPKAAPV